MNKIKSTTELKVEWNKHKDTIYQLIKNEQIHPEELEIEDLINLNYKCVQGYYYHPCLANHFKDTEWFTFLRKSAMLEATLGEKNGIAKFIYFIDKECNRIARGIDDKTYDRFDKFKFGYEDNGKILRHFGTIKGQEAYGKFPINRERNLKRGVTTRSNFRASNKTFLRGLMFGFSDENLNRTLVCPLDGSKIEGIFTFCENSNEMVMSDCSEVHHAKYDQVGSFYKSTTPSEYLNKSEYVNFTQEIIEEFLGCIILSKSSHMRVHDTHKVDGINNWLARVKNGRCIFIPYHWRSEECYNKTLATLEEKCHKFKASDALNYHDFLARHNSTRARTAEETVKEKTKKED
jgi:hypothetical protein